MNELKQLVNEVFHEYGFKQVILLNQFHKDTSRLIIKVSADNEVLLLRGIPDTISEETIQGNTMAHEYLGNKRGLAPAIIKLKNGKSYIHKQSYWFYILKYIDGNKLEENEMDEYELAKVVRILHSYSDYKIKSNLNEDKTRFYDWFKDKRFKTEFDRILDSIPNFNQYDRCFIHSDIGPHNSIRTSEGRIMLIDLDDAGIGSRYLDLGWPFIMQYVEHNHSTGEMRYRFDLAKAFLKGYYGNSKLEKEEYDLIWQGAAFMHISYMKEYGPYAVDSLWDILKFGLEQKEKLWKLIYLEKIL